MRDAARYVVGIDVGGTFTDVTVLDRVSGRTEAFKALSNRAHPDEGVLSALARSGIAAEAIERIVHGTTVATNTLLERRGGADCVDHDGGVSRRAGAGADDPSGAEHAV